MLIGVSMKLKRLAFHRRAVLRATRRGTRETLDRLGGRLRTIARRSLRYRKRASRPGQPPCSHTGVLRNRLFYGQDRTGNVVVGPEKSNQVFFDRHRRPVRGTVPRVLEFGGQITILEIFRHGRWERADLRARRRWAQYPQRYRTVTIAPRPFMAPALEKLRPKIPNYWRGAVRAG